MMKVKGLDELVGRGGGGDHWHCAADRQSQIKSSGSGGPRPIAVDVVLYLSVMSDGC